MEQNQLLQDFSRLLVIGLAIGVSYIWRVAASRTVDAYLPEDDTHLSTYWLVAIFVAFLVALATRYVSQRYPEQRAHLMTLLKVPGAKHKPS